MRVVSKIPLVVDPLGCNGKCRKGGIGASLQLEASRILSLALQHPQVCEMDLARLSFK